MIKLKNFLRRIQTKIYLALITILVTGLIILNSYTNYLHKTINASNDKNMAVYVISSNKDLTKDFSSLDKVKKVELGLTLKSTTNLYDLHHYFLQPFDNHSGEIFIFPSDNYSVEYNALILTRDMDNEEYLAQNYEQNINKTFEFYNSSFKTNLKIQDYHNTNLQESLVNKKTFFKLLQNSTEYI